MLPRRQTAGVSARSGTYVLRWDESGELTRSLDDFRGFKFGGDCRTPLPNQFFDEVLVGENHSVVRIVGAVLRHTVGYTNGITGERIEEAPLSYNKLLAFSPMDRKTLATALRIAEASGYIRTVAAGRFSPDKRRQRAAVYAVRWNDELATRPTERDDASSGSRIPPEWGLRSDAERFTDSIRPSADNSSPIPPAERFTDATSHGSKFPPEERFTLSTTKKTTPQRQQQNKRPDAAVAPLGEVKRVGDKVIDRLVTLGLSDAVARRLVAEHGIDEARRQLGWLPRRSASRNVAGLLRRAIEEAWAEPRVARHPATSSNGATNSVEAEAARQRRGKHMSTTTVPLTSRRWPKLKIAFRATSPIATPPSPRLAPTDARSWRKRPAPSHRGCVAAS